MKKGMFLRFALFVFFALFALPLCPPAQAAIQDAERSFLDICENGTPSEIEQALSEGASIYDRDEDNFTPLMAAAFSNSLESVSLLLKAGAEANTSDIMGLTPLMYAAANNPDVNVCCALIEAGADVRQTDDEGFTPLMYTAINNNPFVAEALIKAGSQLFQRNNNGKTAFDLAVKHNSHSVILILKRYQEIKPLEGNPPTKP